MPGWRSDAESGARRGEGQTKNLRRRTKKSRHAAGFSKRREELLLRGVFGGVDSSASGGTSVERSEVSLGEQEGVAIADASGGNNNVSFVS